MKPQAPLPYGPTWTDDAEADRWERRLRRMRRADRIALAACAAVGISLVALTAAAVGGGWLPGRSIDAGKAPSSAH